MKNQAIPHLKVWSKLINIKISNYHGQPRMGTVFTFKWRTSIQQTWMSRWIKKTKKGLDNK